MEKEKTYSKWLNKEVEGIKAPTLAFTTQDQNHSSDFTKMQLHISLGQPVYSADQHLLGPVTRLLRDSQNRLSHLVVSTRRVFRMNKVVPIHFVAKISIENIDLSISRGIFNALRNHREDTAIAEEVDHVLWADPVLRVTDYDHVNFQVHDGTLILRGHVISQMNKMRVEAAVRRVKGVMEIVNQLDSDDELMRDVAGALGTLEQTYGTKFFTGAQNGVITLSGEVSSTLERELAEKYAAAQPHVRGVINYIRAPEIDVDAEDHRFLQPAIGQQIYFQGGQSGNVIRVIINPDNRRVSHLVVRGWFQDHLSLPELENDSAFSQEQVLVIPVSAVKYLTRHSGKLTLTSREAIRRSETAPVITAPPPDWVPPYPYHYDEVLFSQSSRPVLALLPETAQPLVWELAAFEGVR